MKKTVSLTYGAMTVALTGIILFFDRITLGMLMSFLALPLIVYGSYFSFKDSIVVYISCVLIAMILSGMIPTVLLMAGYGATGLAYIFARQHKFKTIQVYMIMSIIMTVFYYIMISFFGPFFGIDIPHTVRVINTVLGPQNKIIVTIVAYLTVILTMVMEIFIIKASSDIVIRLISRNRN